jgi:hypothetical protein
MWVTALSRRPDPREFRNPDDSTDLRWPERRRSVSVRDAKALSGTAFDKANALSQEEPSLFWMAVEVVGVAVDAAAAFKAISSAVKAVKAVEEAGDAVRVVQRPKSCRM